MKSEHRYYTLEVGVFRQGDTYIAELSHSDPDSHARVVPQRGVAALDPAALRALQGDDRGYGAELARQLFGEPLLQTRFLDVERAAQVSGCLLRLSVAIDPSAQDLHGLRWELLRHPSTGDLLATSERVLFSRFMVSRDWRPIQLRARSELVALIAVSAPDGPRFARSGLAQVDGAGEAARVRAALSGIDVRTAGGPQESLTLDRLVDALRDGVDILYLVSHGAIRKSTGEATLFLQDPVGDIDPVDGESLCSRICELPKPPRLVVLASCESGGSEDEGRMAAQGSLARRLADVGVPAVIAMQGRISMATVEGMMPVLFRELGVDGRIDRALAVARGSVRNRPDAWMPALYSRLRDGQLWYTAGFRGAKGGQGEDVWRRLLPPIRAGKLVPILGPGLLGAVHGTAGQLARTLAAEKRFPMAANDWDDLPRVNQFLSVRESRYNLVALHQERLVDELLRRHRMWLPADELPPARKPKLGRLLGLVGDHLRETGKADPHAILAGLDASIYVTTTFDSLMERALKAAGRPPQQALSRWRYKKAPVSQDVADVKPPTPDSPMVYHAFGAFGVDTDDTLVLTEDDYFDYMIATSAGKLMPRRVESALVNNSLLFLGFRLTDWSFRVLFRLMMSLDGRELLKNYCHVAVQLDPEMQEMQDVEGAKAYLAEYFGQESNIDIYWGSAEEFLGSLRAELAGSGDNVPAPGRDEEADDWAY